MLIRFGIGIVQSDIGLNGYTRFLCLCLEDVRKPFLLDLLVV